MPIPRSIVAYAAGTDTRNQFTTPPDARQVADLVAAHEDPIVGGQIIRSATWSTTFAVASSSSWTVVPVTSAALEATDGNWDTANDCWGPPDDWFDDWTYVLVDCPWTVAWEGFSASGSGFAQVNFLVKSQASGSDVTYKVYDEYASSTYLIDGADNGYAIPFVDSGCMTLKLAQGQKVKMRVLQTGPTYMDPVTVHWGIRLVGGTD